jgi:tetratricopeptide (TPR) repeat protein
MPSSPNSEKRWIVKESEGKIWGPYTTAQILEQIERGYYVGGEQVATFPGGQWIAISKTPEFYDRLLDVLVQEGRPQPRHDETVFNAEVTEKKNIVPGGELTDPGSGQVSRGNPSDVIPQPTGKSSTDIGRRTGASVTQLRTLTKTQVNAPAPVGGGTRTNAVGLPNTSASVGMQNAPNIELTDLKRLEAKEAKAGGGSNLIPKVLIALAVILGLFIFFDDEKPKGVLNANRVHLLQPRKGAPELAEAVVAEKYKRALASFQVDTYKTYQTAQNELVEIVEGMSKKPEMASRNAERLAFLCLTYREMWPYAFQDSQDLKTVSLVMQEAKRLDPAGRSGATCEIVQLMLNGRNRDAQGLTDSMLVEESQTPVLFEIRGDLYATVRDYDSASNYFEQAKVMWPAWQKITVEEARAKQKVRKYPEATELYRSVLAKVPQHPVAKIELGIMEASVFQHPDEGAALIKTALDGKEKIPDVVASNGWLGLAKIQESKNLSAKAGEYAMKAYKLNAANLEAKSMAERLNGKVSAPGPKEAQGLIVLGDQYFQQGDFFQAQAQYKTAFEADPKSGISAMKAARCLWALNQSSDAIEWMKRSVAADPQLTAAYVYLAEYYARRFDFQAATQILAKAQRLQPNSYEVYRGLANVELIRNNFKGAVQYGTRALKLYESDIDTYLIMSKANMGLRDFQAAERFAARAIELDFNSTEAQSLFGKSQAGLRGVEAGVTYMQSLINRYVITKGKQVPQAAIDYRVTLGDIYLSDQRNGPAEQAYQQALTFDADNKRALMGLAKSLQAQNKQAQALEAFLRAAVLDPSDADPIYFSGQLYAEVGKPKEALKQFERVLKINSRFPRAHVALGQMYLRTGDSKTALEEAMKEREINPGLRDSYILSAEAYFSMKQYSNCAAEYQQASKGQRDASLLTKMARCYRLSGALDSAQSLLKQAQSIESGNPDVYKEQGAIFQMKGMADEAVAAYDTYLKLMPAASDRAEIERREQRVRSGDLDVGE